MIIIRFIIFILIIIVLIVTLNAIHYNNIVDPLKEDAIFNLIHRNYDNNTFTDEFRNIIKINRAAVNYKNEKGLTPLMVCI